MAASMQSDMMVHEEDLCCYICLEQYENPRTLPCLHSFCNICLTGYANRAFDEGKKKINCPICRADTYADKSFVAGDASTSSRWVESLPVNTSLVSILSDKSRPVSKNNGNKCDQCLRDKLDTGATVYCYDCSEKLCELCTDMHGKVKVSSSHKLYDIRNNPENVAKIEILKSLTTCPVHRSEEIRYLCTDHDQLFCIECAVMEHRKCEMVREVQEHYEMNKHTNGTFYKLKQLSGYLDELTGYETKHQSSVQDCRAEMKDKFKQIKKRIDTAFHEMEKAVTSAFEEESSLILKESGLQKEGIQLLKSDVKHSLSKIETANEFGDSKQVFIVDRILQKELTTLENRAKLIHDKMSKSVVRVIQNNTCKELEQEIANCLQIKFEPSGFAIPVVPRVLKYKSWLEAVENTESAPAPHRPTKARSPVLDVILKGLQRDVGYHSNSKMFAPAVKQCKPPPDIKEHSEKDSKPNIIKVVSLETDNEINETDENDEHLDYLESVRHVCYSRLQKQEKRKYRKN